MGSNLNKFRSLNLNTKILSIGALASFGFLGTFLLNNFLSENYNAKKLEIEEKIENLLNKKVNLGDYSGIRFLGISLGNSKIHDKKNIDSEIKAKNLYVGIMPFRSLLNQKWVIKIKPEKTEINIDRDFFKIEKSYLSNKNVSNSNLNYEFNFNLANYSTFKFREIGLDTKVKGDLRYDPADKQIIGKFVSNFEDRGKLKLNFNKKLDKDFLKFEIISNGLNLGSSEYNIGNRQFLLKQGKFKSNLKFQKISNQAICRGGFSLNKIKLNTTGLDKDLNSDSLNFICKENNLIADNLELNYGTLISDFNLNVPLNQKVNEIDLGGKIKFKNSSNPDLKLSGGLEYWIDKKGIAFGKLDLNFELSRTNLENLNIFRERRIGGLISAKGDIGGSINKPQLSVKFDIADPEYKNLKNKEIWAGKIDNKNELYRIELKNYKSRSSPVPTDIILKLDSNLKLNKANIRRLSLSKKGLNKGNLNMVREGNQITWEAINFPLNELKMAIGNDKFDSVSGTINGEGLVSLKENSYSGRLAWSLGEYRNIKFANSLFSLNFKDENYDLNASIYPNDGGIIEINNDSSNKKFFDISFENVSSDWTLLTLVDILDFDNNQINNNSKKIKSLEIDNNQINKKNKSKKIKSLEIDLSKKPLEEKVNFINDFKASIFDYQDKYNLKRFINKFDGRYNAEFLIDAKDKNNLNIQNAYLDGTIQGNKKTSSSETSSIEKEKISLRLTGGIQKGSGVMNVDKIPLNTLNLFLDNPIDLNGSLNFDLIYDRDKKSYQIPNINSVNTSVNKNNFKFSKSKIKLNDQILTTDLELKYDYSDKPFIFLNGSIPIIKSEKKDLVVSEEKKMGLTFFGDKEFIDIVDVFSKDYFDFKRGELFSFTFNIRGSIANPELSGRLNIIDSEVDFLETNLKNVNGNIFWNFYDNFFEIINFELKDEDEGEIFINGVIPLYLSEDLTDKNISLIAKNLNLISENFNYIYDSNLDVRGSISKPIFSGNITFKDGYYKLKNFNLENVDDKRDWEELNWNYVGENVDEIEIISDETPFSLVELRKIIPNYMQNFSFDNLKLKFGPNFRLEYLNIIKTYLDTNKGAASDLKINGSIKEDIIKEKDNLNNYDQFKCGPLSLQGVIYLTNGIANLYTTPFKLNKNNDNHVAFVSGNCLVPLIDFSLISKVPEPITKINQNNKDSDNSADLSPNDNSRDFSAIGVGNTRLIRIEASYLGFLDDLRSSENIFLRSSPSYNRSQIIGLMTGNSANLINRTFISQINNADAFSEKFQLSLYPALIENNDSLSNIYSNDNLDLANSGDSTINMGGSSEEWIAEIGFDIDSWINLAVQTIPGRDDIPTQGILTLQLDPNNDFFDVQLTGSSDVEGDWKSQIQLFLRY